jgi:hypothetical protein
MTETPKYQVIKKDQDFELRTYSPYIRAEVELPGKTYQRAIYQGFNILAGYIFGDNHKSVKIDMTSPVQVSQPEKIAMTQPVTIQGGENYSVSFVMPSSYSLESLPVPHNDSIHFTQIPAQTVAALPFNGYFIKRKVRKAKQRLLAWVEKQGYSPVGEMLVARYDPPWVPWFLARNEVMIRVTSGEVGDID